MSQTPPEPSPDSVGQQLRDRREYLDLTQESLARRIGITARSISSTERDETEIRRGKRPAWERALHLKPGTINRAYREGTPIEPGAPESTEQERPYPDPASPKEVAVWAMPLSEADRRELIDLVRANEAQKRNRQQSA